VALYAIELQEVIETYPDGSPKRVASIGHGDLKSEETVYNQDGSINYRKFYLAGSVEDFGLWKKFDKEGSPKDSGNFIVGDKEDLFIENPPKGEYVEYYDNGEIKLKTSFVNQLIHGDWNSYYGNGNVKSEGLVSNGKGGTIWKTYSKSGVLIWDSFYNGEFHYKRWYNQGMIRNESISRNNEPIISRTFYDNGNVETEISFIGDEDHRQIKDFYENGNIEKIYYKKSWENDGEFITYYESGKIEQIGRFQKGKRVGRWKWFYENQQLKKAIDLQPHAEWIFDVTGEYLEFYPDGKLKVEGKFKKGDFVEKYIYYDESGDILFKVTSFEESENWDFDFSISGWQIMLNLKPKEQ
jgi:antitoxin component YwqK of YwqJK toxin-antitoxin module